VICKFTKSWLERVKKWRNFTSLFAFIKSATLSFRCRKLWYSIKTTDYRIVLVSFWKKQYYCRSLWVACCFHATSNLNYEVLSTKIAKSFSYVHVFIICKKSTFCRQLVNFCWESIGVNQHSVFGVTYKRHNNIIYNSRPK